MTKLEEIKNAASGSFAPLDDAKKSMEDFQSKVKAEIEGKMKTTDLVSKKDRKRITDYHYARRRNVGDVIKCRFCSLAATRIELQ